MKSNKPRTKSFITIQRSAFLLGTRRKAVLACLLVVAGLLAYSGVRTLNVLAADSQANNLWPRKWQSAFEQSTTINGAILQAGSSAPRSAASSLKPGSVLFFHKYTSDLNHPDKVNTLLTLTNTNPDDGVTMRLFYVHNCQITDKFLNLAANQTRTIAMSVESPGDSGYVIAIAVTPNGIPTQFNWVIGSASVRDEQGREYSYNAFSVAKRTASVAPSNGETATLTFDNTQYDRLPKTSAIDNIQNQDPQAGIANHTEISFYTPLADLSGSQISSAKTIATAYDQTGKAYPTELNNICGLYGNVDDFFWTSPSVNTFIKPGKPGWATLAATVDIPISRTQTETVPVPVLGLSLNTSASTSWHSARAMQSLDWIDKYQISMPIKVPVAAAVEALSSDQPAATGGANGASEMKAGSIILYPRYATGDYGSTQINLTNTHPTQKSRIRLYFNNLVGTPQTTDQIITLNPRQATTLDLNSIAPNQRGWIMAVAINSGAQPIQFNYLIGSTMITEPGGFNADFAAIAIAKNSAGPVPRNEDIKTADLLFDDANYDRLPSIQALSSYTNQLTNTARLGYSRLSENMLLAPNNRGAANIFVYDRNTSLYSGLLGASETKIADLQRIRFTPLLPLIALRDNSGWVKLQVSSPAIGWYYSLGAGTVTANNDGTWTGGFSGGGNLPILGISDSFAIKVQAGNPGNQSPIAEFQGVETFVEARSKSGTIVRLDASPSSDPDPGDTLTYQWYIDGQAVSKAVIFDYRLSIGTHEIKLYVTDSSGQISEPIGQTVYVRDSTPPQISGIPFPITATTPGNSVNVRFDMPVAFDMLDGPVSVTASKPSGSSFPIGTSKLVFTAQDNAGNKSTTSIDVVVSPGPNPGQSGGDATSIVPTMNNLEDQYVTPGEVRNILLQASDANGDSVSFRLVGAPSYAKIVNPDPVARQATLQITAPAQTTEYGRVQVIVSDQSRQSFATLPFIIAVSPIPNGDGSGSGGGGTGGGGNGGGNNGGGGDGGGIGQSNNPPIPVIAPLPASIVANTADGVQLLLDGSASNDPDVDTLAYSWKIDGQEVSQQPIADVKIPLGTHTIVLTVSDGRGGIVTSNPVTIQVLPRPLSVTDVSPFRLSRGTNTISIIGTGFTANSVVTVSGAGTSVLKPYVSVSESKIVVKVSVSSTAPTGYRDVIVNNPDGTSAILRGKLSLGL